MVADYAKHKKPHHYRLDGHSTVHGNAFLATWLFDKIQPSLVKQQHPTTFQN
jgi:hypothetical protein